MALYNLLMVVVYPDELPEYAGRPRLVMSMYPVVI